MKKRLNKTEIEAQNKKIESFVETLDLENDSVTSLTLEVLNEFEGITKAKATRAVKRVIERV